MIAGLSGVINMSEEEQKERIEQEELKSQKVGQELQSAADKAEQWLGKIRKALKEIDSSENETVSNPR